MAAYTANQVSINNGQKNIVINSSESPEGVSKGDFICIGSFTPMEINRTYINSNSQHVIELAKPWSNSNQSNQPAIVIPTTVQFKETVQALQNANTLINDNTQAMQNWQTKTGSVEFVNVDGTKTTVKTLKQIELDNRTQMEAYHPHPYAMRKAEFEANRAQNNEKFAASGFVHFGKHQDGIQVNEGLQTSATEPNLLLLGKQNTLVSGGSKTEYPVISMAGVTTNIINMSRSPESSLLAEINLPPAEDGTRTYDSATGVSVTHATPAIAFASETATNKVVIDRVDMWGFEAYLREINDADPFVYANGLIQSLAADINGIATVDDNVRPITYFAWYTGDDSSRGKGVNWQTASEASRTKIASDPANNIYFDDGTGKFYQWCIRGRSFAGVGNGDWGNLETTNAKALQFVPFSPNKYVEPQGVDNRPLDFTDGFSAGGHVYVSENTTWYDGGGLNSAGAFRGASGVIAHSNRGSNNQCYFLVCGTVNRLNQGAYHPSFNPMGDSTWWNSTTGGGTAKWHTTKQGWELTAAVGCFDYGGPNNPGKVINRIFVDGGNDAYRGRPDLRSSTYIYTSGQGGVCRDMRYSAWGLKAEDFAEADLKVKSGEYRGRDLPDFTKAVNTEAAAATSGSWDSGTKRIVYYDGDIFFEEGKDQSEYGIGYIISKVTGEIRKFSQVVFQSSTNRTGFFLEGELSDSWTDDSFAILTSKHGGSSSIADEYTHTEVFGDPANILLCDDLKDGWVGSWNPNLPTGDMRYLLTKKCLDFGRDLAIYTSDLGNSWNPTLTALGPDITTNTVGHPTVFAEGGLVVYNYPAKAVMTEDSANSEIYGGARGLGSVALYCFYINQWGGNLVYSCIGKILTGASSSLFIGDTYPLTQYNLRPWENLLDYNYDREPTHSITVNGAVGSAAPAFKALNYNVAENQQGFINYAYTELTHNGTDWGDDGKIHITDNQATRTNDNGNTVLYGTARIVEPLGWIKNDK